MGITDYFSLFKQARELQDKMNELQAGLAAKTVEAGAGGGMVKVTANGLNEILSVRIDGELINMQDREILEDLVTGAVNEAHRKVRELAREEMTRAGGLFKIPGLFTPPNP